MTCERNGLRNAKRWLSHAGVGLICAVFLQSCTISGAGFLSSNSDGRRIEPYSYPVQQSQGNTIHVVEGDTLFSIAQNNQIDLEALAAENGLYPPYNIKPGDRLRVPGPRVHKVASGETIHSISKDYGVDALTLAALNGVGAPYAIHVGDALQLPGGAKSKSKASKKKSGWRLGSSDRKSKSGKKSSVGKKTEAIARSAPRGGGRFLWPAHGTIISTFGGKGGGRRNDGINIAVRSGSQVLAADGGTVSYIGNELGGYGNLILIRHRGGWVTAYAHNNEIWVKKGQAVSRGQHIANAGSSGDADRPQVHFELRRGQKSVDPVKYLNLK